MGIQPPLRAAVGSDQPIFRRGLASLVVAVKEASLVGEARDPAEVRQLCELLEPDLVLLDFKAPPEAGQALALELLGRWPKLSVILMVGAHEDPLPAGLEHPVLYYFSKDISEDEFAAALLRIHSQRRAAVALAAGAALGAAAGAGVLDPDAPGPDAYLTSPAVVGIPAPAGPSASEILQRELVTAGKIQADILPERPPSIPGWDITAGLVSARETSGDFYDFIPLPNGHWGIVVADVTDKGMGAALFMALSSTLLRTYAARYPTLPALTMDVVNERILSDTRGGMFVTAFFGILEPHTGRLRYVNAGHPPPLLLSHRKGKKPVDRLNPTGMALGLMERAQWQQKIIRLAEGDVLLLYTDGITEAQNAQDKFYGDARLIEMLREKSHSSAGAIQRSVLAEVQRFTGDTPHQDDIAVIVIRRKP